MYVKDSTSVQLALPMNSAPNVATFGGLTLSDIWLSYTQIMYVLHLLEAFKIYMYLRPYSNVSGLLQ